MKLEEVVEILKNPNADGNIIAEAIGVATAEYAFIAGLLQDILANKPAIWNTYRLNVKSDKAADRLWEATENGINESGYRLKLKSLEKVISALKAMLRIKEQERFS